MAKLTSLLLDTGPVVVFLNGQDPEHEWARSELCVFNGQIHTTTAVVTEVPHSVAPRCGRAGRICLFRAPSGGSLQILGSEA